MQTTARSLKVSVLGLLVCLLAANVSLLGQERFGNITGTATDASGAVLPDVTVVVTNKEQARTVETRTGGDGKFITPDLEPGRYAVRFEKTGFARYEAPDVQVLLGRTVRVDANMQVGSLEQTVQVTEAPPVIDTSSTLIAHNVTAEEFDMLPKTRNFTNLALLSTSVNTGEIEGGLQMNGASAAENNYYIDGVSTTSLIDGSARQGAIFEYLQEVQVKTAGLEAEYGGALGGVVTAVTRSGGNDFHGELHYYYYGNRLNAGPVRRLVLDPAGQQQVAHIQDEKQGRDNQEVGGSLGGPFIKNKLFFFTSFSPRWYRADYNYQFVDGPGTMERKAHFMNWFNKVSFDPTNRIRTNFTWLYTPSYLTGSLFAYDGFGPNASTRDIESARGSGTRGYNQPEQSYTGNVDFTLSNTSLLSVKAGRYYLNYKEVGIPYSYYTWWRASSTDIAGLPADLRQANGFATPSAATVLSDLTTRSYVQADYSQFVSFAGTHNFKAGIGTQKNVNRVNDSWYGPNGRVELYWNLAAALPGGASDRGTYGYYLVQDGSTRGSTGAHITHFYVQDSWRIHPRLTLNLGLRTERETIPSFQRDVQDYAFRFNYGDKIAPRIGASMDVLGDGRLKISGAWGRFYDWTKYDVARGTFGGEIWHTYYRSLDTLDVLNLNLSNMPGRNLWPGTFRNRRVPGFDLLDPNVKPMSADNMNAGVEYQFMPQTVFTARFVRNDLRRTIEDLGALDAEGNEVYRYGNPGEGAYTVFPSSGQTCTIQVGEACGFPMPRAERTYNALEMMVTRRFGNGWFANISYVYSRLRGNYAGLQSTDEIRPPTLPYTSPGNQQFAGQIYRSGGNANRNWDLDEIMWDAQGNLGQYGPLPTDRPHVVKLYGSKRFDFGIHGVELGGFIRAMSGTPMSTEVNTINGIPVLVDGRGDMGRTPFFTQTDVVAAYELGVGEGKRLRFEFNALNLFNQKTSMFTYNRYNREELYTSSGIDLHDTDLSQGYDWRSMVTRTPAAQENLALDPRYGLAAIFNEGFQGRFLVKYIF
jgi:hypothetical protein